MKVVLIKDLRGLGRKDDVRDISDGYARNFLIPRGIAKLATGKELEKIDTKKHNLEEIRTRSKEVLEELHRETQSAPISVPIKTGSKGEIFSSIKEEDVRRALIIARPQLRELEFGIKLEGHIKEVGVHEIGISVSGGIKNAFKIEIIPKTNS